MARWKARVEFLLSVIELLFLYLTVDALQGKMCQNSLPSGVGRSFGAGQTDRQTDRRTDGIAVANTALAMRALRAL